MPQSNKKRLSGSNEAPKSTIASTDSSTHNQDHDHDHENWPGASTETTALGTASAVDLIPHHSEASHGDYFLNSAFTDEDWTQMLGTSTYRSSPTASLSAEWPATSRHAPPDSQQMALCISGHSHDLDPSLSSPTVSLRHSCYKT